MASPNSVPPPITTTHALEITKRNDRHKTRRRFIGPMPEKVLLKQVGVKSKTAKKRGLFRAASQHGNDEDASSLSEVIKQQAFHYFTGRGGRPEDWGEHEERSVREEMLERWRNSEYVQARRRRRAGNAAAAKWIGSGFEVGEFLGTNVLDRARPRSTRSGASTHANGLASTSQVHLLPNAPPLDDSFSASQSIQAHVASLSPSAASQSIRPRPSTSSIRNQPAGIANAGLSPNSPVDRPISSSSQTPLLHADRGPDDARSTALANPAPKITLTPSPSEGILPPATRVGKSVHYADAPASPREVLERTGSSVRETSAGAAAAASSENAVEWGDVIMRDRMLIRALYSREEVGAGFDEAKNLTARHLQLKDWGEFMVVWRKSRLEIYEDFTLPAKEWMLGHKHLAHTINLKTSATRLSLYSFVDLTFCLSTPTKQQDGTNGGLFQSKGYNIYIFKCRSRSRAADWTWQLWRQLGGQVPDSLELRVPALDTRMTVDVPNADNWEVTGNQLTTEDVLGVCSKALQTLPDWAQLIEKPISEGDGELQLAWRMDLNLDWIYYDEDIDGKQRKWTVVYGIALKQSKKAAHLELRLGRHFPTHLHLKDGARLDEPAAIEGYLDRIKPNTQNRQPVYLSTHDGNLFSLNPTRSYPPPPPNLPPDGVSLEDAATTLRSHEVERGALQVMYADGVTDLRNILAVRRAFQVQVQPLHSEESGRANGAGSQVWQAGELNAEDIETSASDDEDDGGEESLNKSQDKPRTRMKRSFELLLKTGHVIRFEAYSRRVALEWIQRLRELVTYWSKRHFIDARAEMDLSDMNRPRLTPHIHAFGDDPMAPPEAPPDPEASSPALGMFYNWCVLDGCRPILKGGRLYERKGMRGQYKNIQMFLISGNLIQYHITSRSSLNHRRKGRTINLLDAYVCSGTFAAQMLPDGQYDPNLSPTPRRYQDGLEASDSEEDTLFMIWHYPQAAETGIREDEEDNQAPQMGANAKIPALSAKRKVGVFRTRSRLERDAWCWAINAEIEKIVHKAKDREKKVREAGGLVKL